MIPTKFGMANIKRTEPTFYLTPYDVKWITKDKINDIDENPDFCERYDINYDPDNAKSRFQKLVRVKIPVSELNRKADGLDL